MRNLTFLGWYFSRDSYAGLRLLNRIKPRTSFDLDGAVIVDGFPRSGITFTVQSIKFQNPDIKILSHTHGLAVFRNKRFKGRQVLLLVREPVGSISSLYSREGFNVRLCLLRYIVFYTMLPKPSNWLMYSADNFDREVAKKLNEMGLSKRDSFSSDELESVKRNTVQSEIVFSGTADPVKISIPSKEKSELKAQNEKLVRSHKILLNLAQKAFDRYIDRG